MASTFVVVHTPASAAVQHSCQSGWHTVAVDTEHWPEDERELLAMSIHDEPGGPYYAKPRRKNGRSNPWDVVPPTEAGLRASLQARLASAAALAERLSTGRKKAPPAEASGANS